MIPWVTAWFIQPQYKVHGANLDLYCKKYLVTVKSFVFYLIVRYELFTFDEPSFYMEHVRHEEKHVVSNGGNCRGYNPGYLRVGTVEGRDNKQLRRK